MTELICIVCPRGCRLQVDAETVTVSSAINVRVRSVWRDELRIRTRMITSTVRVTGLCTPGVL